MKKSILLTGILSILLAGQAYAGLSFMKTTTLLTKEKEEILLRQKVYSEGDLVRIEEESVGIEGNPGIKIYDFQKKKLYTIMLDIKLYIEQDIGFEKESILFEMSPEKKYVNYKDVKVERTKRGEETLDGHPAIQYEVKVIRKGEKGKGEQVLEKYRLWVAKDLDEMPLQYEFELQNNGKKVIRYTDIETLGLEPSLFSIPEGYKAISPF